MFYLIIKVHKEYKQEKKNLHKPTLNQKIAIMDDNERAKKKYPSYLQSERRPQLLKHKCLQEEYEDHFLQFSENQSWIFQTDH